VLGPLEGYIKRLRGSDDAPDADGIAALRDTIELTREVMQRLDARDARLPDPAALAARLTALCEALPEAHAAWEHAATPATMNESPSAPGTEARSSDFDARAGVSPVQELSLADELAAALAGIDVPEPPPVSHDDIAAVASDEAFEAMYGQPVGDGLDADVAALLDRATDTDGDADAASGGAADGGLAADAGLASADETAFDFPAAEALPPTATPAEREPPEAAGLVLAEETDAGIEGLSFDLSEDDFAVLDLADEAAETTVRGEDPADAPFQAERLAAADAAASTDAPAAEAPHIDRMPSAPPLADDPQPEGVLDAGDTDDDLLDIFVQEGADILDHSDSMVARLRDAPRDRNLVVGLQRDLHTLKGGARMAGLAPIGDLSHAMESLVDAISEERHPVDRIAIESLERGFDRLHVLVQRVAQRRAIAMPVHAIERFEHLVSGTDLSDVRAEAHEPLAAAPEPVAAAAQHEAAVAKAAAPRPAPRHLTAMDQEEQTHAPQEMIRVRSDLLDSLVNYAGEVSIYRSRLEQQISTFRFNLVEFEQTVSRLREQLRKLEIETEAQIIARYQREQHDALEGAFDPLELDRFSQLQQLSRALGESVSDLVSIQNLLDEQTRQSETLLLQQSRVSSDLQEGLMRTRMVPFDSLVPNLRRTLRQAAQETGKRAQLKVDGAHGEMDRNLLERMKAPFEHMLRNALAHGIESPEDRAAAGKPAEGTVNIAVSREATEVVLRIADDGSGMDRDAIRRKAIERGLLKPDVELSDRDLYGFVLETGFSTAEHVTQLAGRGVGMDVVHNEIKQLGGSLAIDSTRGQGTQFTIRLPFTLAVTQAILVKLGESAYAVPMSSVQGVARIAREDLERRIAEGNPKHAYAGEEYVIYDLAQLLGIPRGRPGDDTQVPLLMTRTGDQRAAVRIDGVVGSREIVVKSVGPQVSSVPGIFGATIMGDGSVVIILDLAPLVRRLAALRARIDSGAEESPAFMAAAPVHAPETRTKPMVMVVDDSITMRKVTTRVLERADFEVMTAKDGLDALEKLQDSVPDLMLLDIEMPRMDGYELATYMRNDPRLRGVPIIMITSRTGEKHRQRAFEIGVERYLGKPYQEDDLLRNVHETLRRPRG